MKEGTDERGFIEEREREDLGSVKKERGTTGKEPTGDEVAVFGKDGERGKLVGPTSRSI